jgi:LPXTG-motif cell wall-anchored protein
MITNLTSSAPVSKGGSGSTIAVLLGVAAILGAGYYFLIYKPEQEAIAAEKAKN